MLLLLSLGNCNSFRTEITEFTEIINLKFLSVLSALRAKFYILVLLNSGILSKSLRASWRISFVSFITW